MKRYEDARNAYLKAIELAPLDPNNYSRMAAVSEELNDIIGIFEWRLKNVRADPQDHEVAGHLAREFYEWGLPEEGDRWMDRVKALAPNSDILQRLYIDRADAREDAATLIKVAEKMIAAPASMRQDAFPTALFNYRRYMSIAGRHKEAYDFLTGLRPELKSFESLPDDTQGVLMQWVSIELMTGFSSPEERKSAWEKYAQNLRAHGSWWLESAMDQAVDLFFMGDLDAAIKKTQEDLAQPLSTWPIRGEEWADPIWTPITSNPEIAARLFEMKQEKQQAREQINEMLQGPEWTQ
jgi:tetratricopeptide (TPR) repeat protein